jgi:hypothetical protein
MVISSGALDHHHHHQITKLSHSINAIGPRPTGAAKKGSTAPLCLQLLRTSQACTRYTEMLLDITRQTPLLPHLISTSERCCLLVQQPLGGSCVITTVMSWRHCKYGESWQHTCRVYCIWLWA